MADPVILYNPRLQPVELHADGQVRIVAAGERVECGRSRQIDRLIADGALQLVDPPAPAVVEPEPEPQAPRRRHSVPRRPI